MEELLEGLLDGALRCPHCGVIQEKATLTTTPLIYCEACGRSFFRCWRDGMYGPVPEPPEHHAHEEPHPVDLPAEPHMHRVLPRVHPGEDD